MKIDTEANGGDKISIGATRKELYTGLAIVLAAFDWICRNL